MTDPVSPFHAFHTRHGDSLALWPAGRIRLLRWVCLIAAAAILLGFTQSAEISLALRLFEAAIGVALLLLFVWLRGATPAGGGLRIDAHGVMLLPDGPLIPPDDIETIAIETATLRPATLVMRTGSAHDVSIPLRARLSGHDARIVCPQISADRASA